MRPLRTQPASGCGVTSPRVCPQGCLDPNALADPQPKPARRPTSARACLRGANQKYLAQLLPNYPSKTCTRLFTHKVAAHPRVRIGGKRVERGAQGRSGSNPTAGPLQPELARPLRLQIEPVRRATSDRTRSQGHFSSNPSSRDHSNPSSQGRFTPSPLAGLPRADPSPRGCSAGYFSPSPPMFWKRFWSISVG